MLYDKSLERDNCGFGLIAHIEGEPSHKVVRTAIHALARMQHRGAILADGKTGDGCGLLLQKPDQLCIFLIVAVLAALYCLLQRAHHVRVVGVVFAAVNVLQQTALADRLTRQPGMFGEVQQILQEVGKTRAADATDHALEA